MSSNVQTMGKVLTKITIKNRIDESDASRGMIAEEQVRSVTIEDALVDTGATTLCLPADAITHLGLELLREVDVVTSTGLSKARIFRDATISICGRKGTFECLELPGGESPLIGVIPLEFLGLEPDLTNQRLRVLPSESAATYLTIL